MVLVISAKSMCSKSSNKAFPAEERSEVLQKLRYFCSSRERHTAEVTEKMKCLGIPVSEFSSLAEELRKEKFLDDRRFAGAFARGKFRINRWGRLKIRLELAGRGIPGELIAEGLLEIDEEEYRSVIRNLVLKKFNEIKGEKKLTIRNKIFTFVSGKGFEPDLVSETITELNL